MGFTGVGCPIYSNIYGMDSQDGDPILSFGNPVRKTWGIAEVASYADPGGSGDWCVHGLKRVEVDFYPSLRACTRVRFFPVFLHGSSFV